MKILISIDTGAAAKMVLQEAQTFLKGFPNAEVHVFTVIDMAMIAVGHDGNESMLMDTLQREANEMVNVAARIFGERGFIFSSEVGYPVDEIIQKIESLPCDLLIIGTHGRTGIDHLLIGSVAEKVIRQSGCNTLVIPMKKAAK
jgi:nucleotide-binding universal stress UspA family protein